MNYIDLYELIVKYYPLGISRGDLIYNDYRGTKELKNIVFDHLNSPEEKNQREDLLKAIKTNFPELQVVISAFRPHDICYSLKLSIDKKVIENFTYTQELCCHISFLGNYFCIYGRDSIYIDKGNDLKLTFEPIITISPVNNFDKYFKGVRTAVEKIFPSYKFLCYQFLAKRVDGLKIFEHLLKARQFSSVFQALFLPENLTDYKKYGDSHYQ